MPLALLAAALQVAAATQARTFKEGQTYLSMLMFLPMVIGMLAAFSNARPAAWRLRVPVFGPASAPGGGAARRRARRLTFALPAVVALGVTALSCGGSPLASLLHILTSDRILYGD